MQQQNMPTKQLPVRLMPRGHKQVSACSLEVMPGGRGRGMRLGGGEGWDSLKGFLFSSQPPTQFQYGRRHTSIRSEEMLTWQSTGFCWEEAAPGQQEEDWCFQQRILMESGEFGEVERVLKIYTMKIMQFLHLFQ